MQKQTIREETQCSMPTQHSPQVGRAVRQRYKALSVVMGDAHECGIRMSYSLNFGCFQVSSWLSGDLVDMVPFMAKLRYILNERIITACYVNIVVLILTLQ